MNKQEVINKLQSSLYPETSISSWDEGYNTGITQAIHTVTELDELDYETEKEKLYTVEIPICNSPLGYHYVLRKTTSGEIIIDSFFTYNWENYDYCQLTEEEIRKDHDWAWKYAKEVEE